MIPQTKELRFETTTHCNYNCIVCPREKLERKKETMSLEDFKFYLDKLLLEKQFEVITFSGYGEPLLDKTLKEKIAYSKSKNLKTCIILTNGYLLTPKKFEELKKVGLDNVRIGIYGANKHTYKKVHGVDGFDTLLNNLIYIHNNKEHIKIGLSYLVVKGINDLEVESWKFLFEPMADEIDVWLPHCWIDGRNYRKSVPKKASCGRPFSGPIQIQVNFDIIMCCFDFNSQIKLGNLKEQTLKDIFDSEPFQSLKKQHQSGIFTNDSLPCIRCDQRNETDLNILIYTNRTKKEDRIGKTSTSLEDLNEKN